MFQNIMLFAIVGLVGLFCAFTGYVIIAGEKEDAKKRKLRKAHNTKAH